MITSGRKIILLAGILLMAVGLLACGASAPEPSDYSEQEPPAFYETEADKKEEMMSPKPTSYPVAAAAAAAAAESFQEPAQASVDSFEVEKAATAQSIPASFESTTSSPVTRAAQDRVIVRTVAMTLVVSDVPESVDRVAGVARDFDGWVVSSNRSAGHSAFVAIRVPAQRLDDVVMQLRQLAVKVKYETTHSQDVTDEYVDTESRIRSLEATEQSLLELLDRADYVEEALHVQQSLTQLQADMEAMKGRIRFLQETSAFSLINVDLELSPAALPVDAGPDRTFSVGQAAQFRASFAPPAGLDDFTFTWDFGDGTPPVTGYGTAPKPEGDGRVTATVNHIYGDDRDSPFIVQLDITGKGETLSAEGSDTIIATVTKIPTIEVFIQEFLDVEEGQEAEYIGSFTSPAGLRDLQYRWDFGDGSPVITGVPEAGVTRTAVNHIFNDYRSKPYNVTLTVTAQSEAGEVKGSGFSTVRVIESQGLIIGGWSAVATGKAATRALSAVAQGVGTLIIWLAIFSPVWLIGGGIAYLLLRLQRRRGRSAFFYGGLSRGEPRESAPAETT